MWWENILKISQVYSAVLSSVPGFCGRIKALVTLRFGGFSFCLAIPAEGKATGQGISGGWFHSRSGSRKDRHEHYSMAAQLASHTLLNDAENITIATIIDDLKLEPHKYDNRPLQLTLQLMSLVTLHTRYKGFIWK